MASPRGGVLTSKKSQPDEATRAGVRFLCQTDLYALAKVVLQRDRPAGTNALSDGFHRPLCEYVQTTPYLKNLYLLARGHFKTSLITVARNVQRLLQNPSARILIASNKADNAEAMLSEIKGHLGNPVLVWAFPEILWPEPERQAERWTTSAITVRRPRRTKEASIEAIGVTGELTSKHYDHGTFDDVVGKENSQTREALLDTINFIRVAESLFDPGSSQDVIGTPWHYADAYAWLLEQKEKHGMQLGVYRRACWVPDPAGTEVPGFGRVRAVFPERFSVEELLRIRTFKGSAEFAAQYLLDPVSADTAYFPRAKITPNIKLRTELPPTDSMWVVMTVDPAISTQRWADYSAICVAGFDSRGIMHLLDLRRGKWPEGELVAQIYDAWARTPNIRAIGFEAISFAKIFRTLFVSEGEKRGQYLPVVTLQRDTKVTKNVRIRALQPLWDAGELVIARDVAALEDFLEEADRWRPDRESTHDDLLDAVVDALQLRLRPGEPGPAHESFYDDPELIERIEWERQVQTERAQRGALPLESGALRLGYMQHKRTTQWDAERARTLESSPLGEFVQ